MTDILEDPRQATLTRIKTLSDVRIPRLESWNYEPCEHHRDVGPQVDCIYQACGGELFAHQRVGVAWLYAVQKGLLADDPGVGKSNQIIALLALMKQRGELDDRAIIIPQTAAVAQWVHELQRWAPGLRVVATTGTIPKPRRLSLYATSWDVAVIGSHCANSDVDNILQIAPYSVLVTDDVDPILSHDNTTHHTVERLSREARYSYTLNATALQTRLEQLHAALVPAGGHDIFGSRVAFKQRYERREKVDVWVNGNRTSSRQFVGYKKVDEFKQKLERVYLRRRADELHDIHMPTMMPPTNEWLTMSMPQRERYSELQDGVMRLIREEGEQVKMATALTKFTYGQQICAGLPALGEPDGPMASPKLDRLFQYMDTAWSDRKVIVYVKNVGMVRAALIRARDQGIGAAMVWGQKQNMDQRDEQVLRFREDDSVRMMIGTTSIERSLNLQVSNTIVGLDTQLNPQRIKQLVGRVKRAGSQHEHIFLFNFFMADTQEERYEEVQIVRQALFDNVFDETNDIFPSLPPLQLLNLMRP